MADQKNAINNIRNFLAGRALGFTRDEALLDEVLKCLFCKIYNKKNGHSGLGVLQAELEVAKSYRKIFNQVVTSYPDLFGKEEEILLGPKEISYINEQFSTLELDTLKNNLVGDLYEIFIGSGYRGQEGQFFTPKVAVDALTLMVNPNKNDIFIDPACGAGGFIKQVISSVGNKVNSELIHGVDKDSYLVKLARIDLLIQFDKKFNISCADTLEWSKNDFEKTPTYNLKERFSLVLTNPPFGSKIVALVDKARSRFELSYKWKFSKETGQFIKTSNFPTNTPPQVLFLERCLTLLKKGGRLGIVVPESLLSGENYKYVVQYLLNHATPLAIIGMPEDLFKTSGKNGTHTKTCLLVAVKKKMKNYRIFMAEAKWCGHDSRGKTIPNNDIPEILKKYKNYISKKRISFDRKGFLVKSAAIKHYILAPRFYDPEPKKMISVLKDSQEIFKFSNLLSKKYIEIATGDEVGKLAYGMGNIPFIRTSDISNWEIKIDPKHHVSESIYSKFAKKQDIREGDILMVRDGTYLIGTCAYITKYDVKAVIQSHLYKIRVNQNPFFDRYYLLALLSSSYVTSQIKTLTFTQDIINSLGDRIKDILLPISKNVSHRNKISKLVKKVIKDRTEARELAKEVRKAVLNSDL